MTAFDPTPLRPDAQVFPNPVSYTPLGQEIPSYPGLTARQYAAIALCVPDSGCDWLDAIINRRRRDEMAKSALAAIIASSEWANPATTIQSFCVDSYNIADAMLAASNKEPGNG